MKIEVYQLTDISSLLAIPKTTLRDRLVKMDIQPILKNRVGKINKHYYSKSQLQAVKSYFTSKSYIPQPKLFNEKIWCEIDENKMPYIVVESALNYMNFIE